LLLEHYAFDLKLCPSLLEGNAQTPIVRTVNLFGQLTFDPFYFLGVFFSTLTILPSNLITLATLLT